MIYKRLSYPLNDKAPVWPGNPKMEIEPFTLIAKGDVANQYQLKIFNHFGSHMDGPKHFNDKGPRLAELPLETFIYEKPLLLDIPKTFREMVTAEDLRPFASKIKDADLLMIRSGFSAQRANNPQRYAAEGPGFSAEAAKYVMDEFPGLKAVALDWISLASYAHNEEGILAHQYMLGMFHDRYVCIIEDLDFSGLDPERLEKVFAMPLFIEGPDSCPVTVLAEMSGAVTDNSSP
jgi:Predicted metal-dependent hydrolase